MATRFVPTKGASDDMVSRATDRFELYAAPAALGPDPEDAMTREFESAAHEEFERVEKENGEVVDSHASKRGYYEENFLDDQASGLVYGVRHEEAGGWGRRELGMEEDQVNSVYPPLDVYDGVSGGMNVETSGYGDENVNEEQELYAGEVLTPDEQAELADIIKRKLHVPIKPRGDRFVPNTSVDRSPALVNKPDATKLRISLQTECDDPLNPGQTISKLITYVFPHNIDWTSQSSITELNAWRAQRFRRSLGTVRESHGKWLMEEHDYVLEILERHLRAEGVDGCWSRVNWTLVAKRFNERFDGRTIAAGAKQAPHKGPNRKKNARTTAAAEQGEDARAKVLKKDQKMTARSAHALRNIVREFTSERAKKLVKDAKATDEEVRLRNRYVPLATDSMFDSASKKRKRGAEHNHQLPAQLGVHAQAGIHTQASTHTQAGAPAQWSVNQHGEAVMPNFHPAEMGPMEARLRGNIDKYDETEQDMQAKRVRNLTHDQLKQMS